MSGEHYFSARPESAVVSRTISVRLTGDDVRLTTAGGVFSAERLDPGTAVLLDAVPAPPTAGDLLDLGCGWGPIALTLARRSPEATVWAVDVNERALDLTRRNAESLGLGNVRAVAPDGVPDGIRFAGLWSNPPIRIGKSALHDLVKTWLPRLSVGAEAWLVVQRNLGADSLQRWLAGEFAGRAHVERAAAEKGYRVLRVAATTHPVD